MFIRHVKRICTCLVNVSELTNPSAFFSPHASIIGNVSDVKNKKKALHTGSSIDLLFYFFS